MALCYFTALSLENSLLGIDLINALIGFAAIDAHLCGLSLDLRRSNKPSPPNDNKPAVLGTWYTRTLSMKDFHI